MANVIKSKRSAVAGNIPSTAQLELGEIGINTNDGLMYIKKDDGVESIITINPDNPTLTTTTGFVDRTQSIISFTEATRTLSLTPIGTDYDIWHLGIKRTIAAPLSIVWSDVEGLHLFYIDSVGVLNEVVTPFDIGFYIESETLVGILYWDQTNGVLITAGDERHGITMDTRTHAYNHSTTGSRYAFGLGPENMLTDENGNLDAHAQFGVSAGQIWDEDLDIPIASKAVTGGLSVLYRTGDALWKVVKNHPYVTYRDPNDVGARAYYNEQVSETVWQLTEVTNNKYMLMHLYATHDIDSPLVLIMGISVYGTVAEARTNAVLELDKLTLSTLPAAEYKSIATFVTQTSASYGNIPNSRILTIDTGADFTDWRHKR